ncbi:MAG: FAD/NAD(P)-binding protein, partial [Candidatus Obscuribacterales bacterium]|nr:FAD/NAD(P)-binding protein [Candidatus Obscuribacterales bacterium]
MLTTHDTTPFMPKRGKIRSIIPLAQDNHLFEIKFEDPGELSTCRPGQFVQLWIPGVGEAPISVCSGDVDGGMELCVHRIGRVTGALFNMSEGDWVGVRGPYGVGFPLEHMEGKNLVLIAGGLGVAPIRSLWQYILDRRERFGKIKLFYGMRHSRMLLFRQEFKWLMRRGDIEVYIAAEEIIGPDLPAASWQLGRVTDLIRMAEIDESFEAAVCGPPVMYKYVVSELIAKGLSKEQIWLSLERHMKCGVGKCGHCFVGGTFTCRKGPVFCLSELEFLPDVVEC